MNIRRNDLLRTLIYKDVPQPRKGDLQLQGTYVQPYSVLINSFTKLLLQVILPTVYESSGSSVSSSTLEVITPFHVSHSGGCVVIPHFCLNWHFPGEQRSCSPVWMFSSHVDI